MLESVASRTAVIFEQFYLTNGFISYKFLHTLSGTIKRPTLEYVTITGKCQKSQQPLSNMIKAIDYKK